MQGIKSSLHQILEKRVLQSLSPLFDSPKLDCELRALICEFFLEFCSIPGANLMPSGNNNHREHKSVKDLTENNIQTI
jgi:Integrator complex subunit 3 N-terminal